jgi:hypothetical protein
MTLDEFKRYAETRDHSLSEYRWSFQDAEERVFTLNDKAWVSFRQLYDDDDSDDFFPEYDPTVEYQLMRIGAPLDGLWEFYKDPRSAHYVAQREHSSKLAPVQKTSLKNKARTSCRTPK